LAIRLESFLTNLVEVVAAMAKIQYIPCIMVAPVLCMVAVVMGERVLVAHGRKELAGSTCGKRYLDAAKANIPVDIVFEYECSLQARIEKPGSESAGTLLSRKTDKTSFPPSRMAGPWGYLPTQGIVVA
jgi:hypothetical protein